MPRKRQKKFSAAKEAHRQARALVGTPPPTKVIPNKRRKPPKHKKKVEEEDIPESTDEELQRARRVGLPSTSHAKQLIAIRIAPRLLAQLRRLAAKQDKPYQTLIHELLEKAAKRKVA